MTDDIRKLLKETKIDDALIPGGCTKYAQASNVVWNKLFKGLVMESYDETFASA